MSELKEIDEHGIDGKSLTQRGNSWAMLGDSIFGAFTTERGFQSLLFADQLGQAASPVLCPFGILGECSRHSSDLPNNLLEFTELVGNRSVASCDPHLPLPPEDCPLPGEDFLHNPPQGVAFPLDLSGASVYVTLEPWLDFDKDPAAPFFLKILEGQVPADPVSLTPYDLSSLADQLPTGTATIQDVS